MHLMGGELITRLLAGPPPLLTLTDREAWAEIDLPPGAVLAAPPPSTVRKPSPRPSIKTLRLEHERSLAPESRRILAELALERIALLTAEPDVKLITLLRQRALKPAHIKRITEPQATGWRDVRGVSCIVDYDKVLAIGELLDIHPPVIWLAHMVVEGPTYDRPGQDPASRPWSGRIQKQLSRVLPDLEALGGAYAAHVPAITRLAQGDTTYDEAGLWLQPVIALLNLERARIT